MEKLKGKYISHKFENNELIVFIKDENGNTTFDTITTRCKVWNKAGVKTELKLSKLEENHRKKMRETDWREREAEYQAIRKSLQEKQNFQFAMMKLYQQINMDALSGLPIEKYWQGKYQERDDMRIQKRKIQEGEKIKLSKLYYLMKKDVYKPARECYEKKYGTSYGASKYAAKQVQMKMKKKGYDKSIKNIIDAMSRVKV